MLLVLFLSRPLLMPLRHPLHERKQPPPDHGHLQQQQYSCTRHTY